MKSMRLFIVLSLICTSATSIHGLLRTGARRLPTSGVSLARVAPQAKVYANRVPTTLKTPARSWSSSASWVTDRLSAWKSQFLNWYRGTTPVSGTSQQQLGLPQPQKELVVPVVVPVVSVDQVEQPKFHAQIVKVEPLKQSEDVAPQVVVSPAVVPTVNKPAAQIESEEILTKLRGKNPWDYSGGTIRNADIAMKSPLANQIKKFLKKNDINAIEDVFVQLLPPSDGRISMDRNDASFFLKSICEDDRWLATKLFPLVKKHIDKINDARFIGTVLLETPEKFVQAEDMRDKFFKIVEWYDLVWWFGAENISRLLPNDPEKLLNVMHRMCHQLSSIALRNDAEKATYNQFVSSLTSALAGRLSNASYESLKGLNEYLLLGWGPDMHLFKQVVVDSNPMLKKVVTEYITTNIEKLLESSTGTEIIYEYILDNSGVKNALVEYLKMDRARIKKLMDLKREKILAELIPYDPMIKKIVIDFVKAGKSPSLFDWLDGQTFLEAILGLDSSYAQTPSYQHLIRHYKDIGELERSGNISSPLFKSMVLRVVSKEKELMGNYEVFYHGRRWQYGFLSQIYDMLYSLLKGKSLENFSFTHFVEQMRGEGSEKFSANQEQMREQLLQEGNTFSWTTYLSENGPSSKEQLQGFLNRQKLLFLNKFLFGNLNRRGSCSIAYVLRNHNIGEIDFPVREIFNMFDYGDIYDMYKKDIDDLQQEYNGLTQFGELLQVAVPREIVNKNVYHTTSGGPKIPFYGQSNNEIKDVNAIVKSLNENPEDEVEFVLVNTYDKFGGLNPDSGIKIFSYNLVEPEKIAAYKEKEKQLFDKIREACRKKEMKEKLAQAERE